MIYKKHKKSYFIISALIALLILSIPVGKQYYKNMYLSLYDKLLTYDTGFSSIHTYFGDGSLSNLSNYPNAINKLPIVAYNILFGSENSNEFEKIEINIKFKNYLTLLEDRANAVKNGVGFDFREVNAKIKFNNKEFDSKVRLKGDLNDHWRSLNKISLRISLKGNSSIMGLKKFSLHKPSARQHPYDQLFQDMQSGMGNITSKHSYVDVYVNGEKWGKMNIEEHISKEFLERQGLKESLVLKFENNQHWKYSKMSKNYYHEYNLSDERFHIVAYGSQDYLDEDIYRRWYSYIAKENLKDNSDLYDNDSFTKSLLLALSWNSMHALAPTNSKYYFNPYSLRLEPITKDQPFFSELNYKLNIPTFYNSLISSSLFKDNFNKNYNLVKDILKNSQESMDYWQSFFPLDEKIKTDILIENLEKIPNNLNKYIGFQEKSFDSDISISKEQSEELLDHIYARHFENGEIHIYNLINEDIAIKSIKIDGTNIQDFQNIKYVSAKNNYSPTILSTDLIGIFDNRISIETQHNNNVRSYTLDYTHLINSINNPLLNKSDMRNYNFIKKVSNNSYRVVNGDWNIYEPIVIDGNLEINENTSLRFDENAYMIIKGSARLIGSKGNEVILKPLKKSWKGLYVFEADSKSIFENVVISNVTFLNDGLLSLTGGVNFYKSDVDILNSKFINSTAEDALNIVKSNFNFKNVEFDNAISDAFDSDFSNGSIESSLFKNINGDAIDFSGSVVVINDSKFINIRDKAVSSGEASNISLENLQISNVGVGIASKDGSITNAKNVDIQNFILKAIMSYRKKDFYSQPEFYGKNIITDNKKSAFLRQVETAMEINGNLIKEELINIDELYENEIMKKQ